MKDEPRKRVVYLSVLFLMSLFAITFVTVMGYLNYRTNAIELEEQAIERIEDDTVTRLETALGFGKSFENFYGIDEILCSFSEQITGPAPFITDKNGELMYAGEGSADDILQITASEQFRKKLASEDDESGKINLGKSKIIYTRIRQDDKSIGNFCCVYTDAIYRSGFGPLKNSLFTLMLITLLILFLAQFFYVFVISDFIGEKLKDDFRILRERVIPMFLMTIGIIVLSALSMVLFQKDYRARADSVIRISLGNLETTIKRVKDQGVELRDISGLDDYIRSRVESLNTLSSVRISERIAEVERTDEGSNVISFTIDSDWSGDQELYLEAEISGGAMRTQITNMILILLSTTIILLIFIFEINNIVELITEQAALRVDGDTCFSERQIGLTLRLTGFLCSTAEYMCIPYAAMLIRESGQSLFGLSVGMTAALPLTVEGFTQMAAVALLPRFVRRYNIRLTLVLSGIMMILCNLTAFFMNAAIFIVICRGIAGIAYGGFKQVSNHMITRGYRTEDGRSSNLSQDNAGLLAGATCGAGLGAILSSNAGYSITFLCSAILTAAYLLVTFCAVPWKALSKTGITETEKKPVSFTDIKKMITSPEFLLFLLFICMPLNIGVMLCVTLIPAVCQINGISSVMLSYCYIGNGLAGIYIGPALVARAKKRFGAIPCIVGIFILTGAGIILLKIPPVIVMIVITGMILGLLDGFGTPLVTDCFMDLKVVKESVDESTALVFSVVVFSVLLTIAPVLAEFMLIPGEGPFTPMLIGAYIYIVFAIIVFLIYRKNKNKI
ncbi:MAG: MFS transporter [Lachnospiraceae bacterium]|nr:MFS transporter [Lachnospiraceae bacterium]